MNASLFRARDGRAVWWLFLGFLGLFWGVSGCAGPGAGEGDAAGEADAGAPKGVHTTAADSASRAAFFPPDPEPASACREGIHLFSRLSDDAGPGPTVVPEYPESWRVIVLDGSRAGKSVHAEIVRSPEWMKILDVAVGKELYLEFYEMEAAGPARVTDIRPAPPVEPGDGALVTGIVERVAVDSTGVDSLCYLEAYRFQDQPPDTGSVWAYIRKFRQRGHISARRGTVAYIRLAGKNFFGVNSSLDDDLWFISDRREGDTRRQWHDRLEPTSPFGRSRARYLTHAEEHALMRAHRRLGYLPPDITLFVDRETCRWCRAGMGSLMRALGIETLTIRQKGIAEPLVFDIRRAAGSE